MTFGYENRILYIQNEQYLDELKWKGVSLSNPTIKTICGITNNGSSSGSQSYSHTSPVSRVLYQA